MEIINNYIKSHFKDSIAVKNQILQDEALIELIKKVAIEITNAYKNGNKTLLAGNGGSAADAQHIAGEFVSRFYFDRPGIPSIALSTDTSILTAIGNDYGYEKLFARQVQAHGVKGDVFIGISTSGNSANIIEVSARQMQGLCHRVDIVALDILDFVEILEITVCHADFLSFKNDGGATQGHRKTCHHH